KFKVEKEKLKELYLKSYQKRYKKNKLLLRFARKLKKEGYVVAVLSDQWHLSSPSLIPKEFHKIFDTFVISCDVGSRKPNLEIYKILLKKLKVRPKEILFIDDRPWNLVPAKKLGIQTILFENN